jgi:hypothetical protein
MADVSKQTSGSDPFEAIKKHAIIAIVSDVELMNMLVLKGGNALDLIYGISPRSSVDLDFSMERDFPRDQLSALRDRIGALLEKEFRSLGYSVFDVILAERPEKVSPQVADFWGGYRLEFKLIEIEKIGQHPFTEKMRRQATEVGPNQKRTFMIDISKHEYCQRKIRYDLQGYTGYANSPEEMVCEKLRAICQQMPEYGEIVPNPSPSKRARDFFDIFVMIERRGVDLSSPAMLDLTRNVFAAKRVPLSLISKIPLYRESHRSDFDAVKNTLKPGEEIKDYDYYFNYVIDKCRALEPLWKE